MLKKCHGVEFFKKKPLWHDFGFRYMSSELETLKFQLKTILLCQK
jgi:hypothetical protein